MSGAAPNKTQSGKTLAGATLAETLANAAEATKSPALTVALKHGDDAPVFAAHGLADTKAGREAVPEDTLSVGSVTKPMVATVVLRLIAEGAFSLDDTIDKYKLNVPHAAEITVKRMLNHTSGIVNFGIPLYQKPIPVLRAFALYDWSYADVEEIINSYPPDFAPGESVKYSNSNYILLGQVVERATGKLLGAHMREMIFDPLGLERIKYRADEDGGWPTLRGYAQAEWGGADITELETWRLFGPGGGIVAPVTEVMHFALALHAGALLDEASQRLLLEDIVWDEAAASGMSCGLQHFKRGWGHFIGHGGNTGGYTAGMWHFPEDKLHLVFGSNRAFVSERPLIQPFVDYVRMHGLPEAEAS